MRKSNMANQYFVLGERSIEAFGYGSNVDPALFCVSVAEGEFYSHTPTAGNRLFKLALIDAPRSTIFATRKCDNGDVAVFRRSDESHSSGTNVIERVDMQTLDEELSRELSGLVKRLQRIYNL